MRGSKGGRLAHGFCYDFGVYLPHLCVKSASTWGNGVNGLSCDAVMPLMFVSRERF